MTLQKVLVMMFLGVFMLGDVVLTAQTMTLPSRNTGGGGITYLASPCVNMSGTDFSFSLVVSNPFVNDAKILTIAGEATATELDDDDFAGDVIQTPNEIIPPGGTSTYTVNIDVADLEIAEFPDQPGNWVIIAIKVEYEVRGILKSFTKHFAFEACGRGGGSGFSARNNSTDENLIDDVKISPNPVQDNIRLEYSLKEAGKDISVDILNVVGDKVMTLYFNDKTLGKNIEDISLDNLSEGIYFINLRIDNEHQIIKFIKM